VCFDDCFVDVVLVFFLDVIELVDEVVVVDVVLVMGLCVVCVDAVE